jgi:carbamate kinase
VTKVKTTGSNSKPEDTLVVIAIGGNSLIKDSDHMSVLDQYRAAGETSGYIAPIVNKGYRVVVTHGNGPQVGFILLRSELAKDVLHQVPLANCVADTQGSIGLQIAQSLQNEFLLQGVEQQVVTIVTQVVVDQDDPSFAHPSKPIGPFMTQLEAQQHEQDDGWEIAEDAAEDRKCDQFSRRRWRGSDHHAATSPRRSATRNLWHTHCALIAEET